MERNTFFILTDGTVCAAAKESPATPKSAQLCIVEHDGLPEFARAIRNEICPKIAEREPPACVFLREATAEDAARLQGNLEAAARARASFVKWVLDNGKPLQVVKARFSLRRERLSMMISVGVFVNFQSIFEHLEKHYQTRVHARVTSPREITAEVGGVGPCGCGLCCRNGVSKHAAPPDMAQAKAQSMMLHDFASSGLCGKLKCCAAFEIGGQRGAAR